MSFELAKDQKDQEGGKPQTFAEEVAKERRRQVSTGGEDRHGDFIMRDRIEQSAAGMDPVASTEGEAKMADQLRAEVAQIGEQIAQVTASMERLAANLNAGQEKLAGSADEKLLSLGRLLAEEVEKQMRTLEVEKDLLEGRKVSLERDLQVL